jgi:hypothetical protein
LLPREFSKSFYFSVFETTLYFIPCALIFALSIFVMLYNGAKKTTVNIPTMSIDDFQLLQVADPSYGRYPDHKSCKQVLLD